MIAKVAGAGAELSKVNFLKVLRTRQFFIENPKALAAMDKLFEAGGFVEELVKTKMCFIAGTKIHTAKGIINIEDVRPGMTVYSRDPKTLLQELKPVVGIFVTHPERLYHLTIRVLGSGGAEDDDPPTNETLVCTGEHPFWVENDLDFVPAKNLVPGSRFQTIDGTSAVLEATEISEASLGTTFTTYNFEVADFHTYFAGETGVWVHNAGAPCQKVRAIYSKLKEKHGGDVWKAFEETRDKIEKLGEANLLRTKLLNEARAQYLEHITGTPALWHNLAAQAGTLPANAVASSARLGRNMEKVYKIEKPFGMESHHIVDKLDNPAVREMLEEAGIHIDEAANGVWLKGRLQVEQYTAKGELKALEDLGPLHSGPHSAAYTQAVENRLLPLRGSPANVIRDELQMIAKELIEETFPW